MQSTPIGCFPIGPAEVRTAKVKLHLFAAIDRTSKFAFVQAAEKAARAAASAFLTAWIKAEPDKIRIVLTGGGISFRCPRRRANGLIARTMTRMLDVRRRENGSKHRLTTLKHL